MEDPSPEAVGHIIEQCGVGEKRNLYKCHGRSWTSIRKEKRTFSDILASFYLNLPDGVPNVWIGRLKGAPEMERCYGPDFFRKMIVSTKDKTINHYFCGGKEKHCGRTQRSLSLEIWQSNVVGTYSPPFKEMS